MKKTAKIFAVLLTVVMVFTLVACEKGDEKAKLEEQKATSQPDVETPSPEDEEKAVRDVVEKFYDAFLEYDLNTAENCIKPGSDAEEVLEEATEVPETFEQLNISKKEIMDMTKKIMRKIEDKLDYEIKEIEIDGENAEVTLETVSPVLDENHEIRKYSINQLIKEYLLEEEGYSNVDLQKISEEEAYEYVTEALEWGCLQMYEDADTKTKEKTVELEKIDGKWNITDVN